MPRGCPIASLEQRFLIKCEKQNDCWFWTGNKFLNGYGQLVKSFWGTAYAHQWSCHHWNNSPLPIPKGFCIKHSCDNKQCVNPEHLSYGSLQENIQEMYERNPNSMNRTAPSEQELELLRQMIVEEVPRREMARRINHSRHWIDRVVRDCL
jgi:hypothetical protein